MNKNLMSFVVVILTIAIRSIRCDYCLGYDGNNNQTKAYCFGECCNVWPSGCCPYSSIWWIWIVVPIVAALLIMILLLIFCLCCRCCCRPRRVSNEMAQQPSRRSRGFFGRRTRRRSSSSSSESSPKTDTKSTQANQQPQPIYVQQQQQQPPVYQTSSDRAQPYEYAYYEPTTRQQQPTVQPYQYLEVDSSSSPLSNGINSISKPNKPVLVLPAPVYTTIY